MNHIVNTLVLDYYQQQAFLHVFHLNEPFANCQANNKEKAEETGTLLLLPGRILYPHHLVR